jgi:hypothetical protein
VDNIKMYITDRMVMGLMDIDIAQDRGRWEGFCENGNET